MPSVANCAIAYQRDIQRAALTSAKNITFAYSEQELAIDRAAIIACFTKISEPDLSGKGFEC